MRVDVAAQRRRVRVGPRAAGRGRSPLPSCASSGPFEPTPPSTKKHAHTQQRLEAVNPALAAERARALAKQREAKKARAEALAKIKADKDAEDKAFAADEVRFFFPFAPGHQRRLAGRPVRRPPSVPTPSHGAGAGPRSGMGGGAGRPAGAGVAAPGCVLCFPRTR